ncbi:hypothetical protein KIW84_062038 [Lathyrus oleraceus]|uniref:Pectate lyase n=1 Tax=Pisum sativum TaxID=3888 RepID=A0A9D4W6L7_PEA|nr:hypothetical protein KIW84_062038 [Pisum sativum]
MTQTICIFLFSLLASFFTHGTSMLNLTLSAQHPDPESVAIEVHRKVNESMRRREMLSISSKDFSSSCETGNPIDDCWKCDKDWSNNRQRLADCAIGFGQNAKGGKGGKFYIVTDSSDNDPVNPKPGNTNVRSSPEHYGYRTISDGDGISIFGSSNIWIDHCTLSRCKDGLIDAVMGSTAITVSNNHFSHHNEVMLLGHSDHYKPDSAMQVTIAFNHFGEQLVQRMPRCRLGYIHVVNNDFTRWEMYAIGGSGGPTIYSQGNRYTAPEDVDAKQVTKRLDSGEGEWTTWNWKSEGDFMVNGAFFVDSGSESEGNFQKAYSIDPKTVDRISVLTMSAGVLGVARDNNLGMWTRAPNGGGDYSISYSGEQEYTDDMSHSTMMLTHSFTLTLVSLFVALLCLLSHAAPILS